MMRVSFFSIFKNLYNPSLLRAAALLIFVILFSSCDSGDSSDSNEEPDVPEVIAEPDPIEPSTPCTLNEECSAGSFYVLNSGCVEEANAINNGNFLVNPGFETDSFDGPFPTAAGGWSGDVVSRVGTEGGIVPAEGDHMLSFDFTFSEPISSSAIAGEIAQIFVLTDELKARINGGETITIRNEAYFNRVAGNENTDSQFLILLMAFDGATEDFSEKFTDRDNQALALSRTDIYSDDCINTWEKATAEFNIPIGTEYIGVLLAAAENIDNDGENATEFDGHYADAVSLYIVE